MANGEEEQSLDSIFSGTSLVGSGHSANESFLGARSYTGG